MWDSVPPLTGIVPFVAVGSEWVAMTGRRARRGVDRPLLIGRDSSGGRRLTTAGHGLWRWVLRGGALLASFMSTVPLLNRFDPLPILKSREDEEDVEPDEDEDTQTSEHVKKVDNMFSNKNQPRQ